MAAAIVAVAMVPVGRAYLAARKVVGERGRDEVAKNSATWRNYLAPPEVNALYGKVFARFMDPERRLFPGFVADRARDRRALCREQRSTPEP